jgi:hypothetical protein
VNPKTVEIAALPSSKAFVFLDEHQNSIDDGHFGFAPEGDKWMNLPRCGTMVDVTFFADGHGEPLKWRDSRTLALKVINSITTPNNPDSNGSSRSQRRN